MSSDSQVKDASTPVPAEATSTSAEQPVAEVTARAAEQPVAEAKASGEPKPAPKKAAKVEGVAAEPKKPKAPEPEVKPEDMADANALFRKIFELVEIQRRPDRSVVDEVERGHARLLQRVAAEAKDLAAWEKKALTAVTDFGGAAQLAGGEARLLQLHNKLWSIRELLDDAHKLR